MKTVNEIKEEIRKLDEAIEDCREAYANGYGDTESFKADINRLFSAKQTLEWVLK